MRSNKDSLWDRMKWYEDVNRNYLMKNSNVIIRLDWKSFHTFTRWLDRPFDNDLIETMKNVTIELSKKIPWFKIAYIQSDEISILINDLDTIQTQWWFDYNINKINSICASMATAYFNKLWNKTNKIAMFDCRCFNIPREDISNYFLRRAKDWNRNSVQMYWRSIYSQKQLHWKKILEIKDMLFNDWCDWDDIDSVYKNWTFVFKNMYTSDIRPDYISIQSNIDPLTKYM